MASRARASTSRHPQFWSIVAFAAAVACLAACPKQNKPPPVFDLAMGPFNTCATMKQGELRCQGRNSAGQLPVKGTGPAPMPVAEAVTVLFGPTALCFDALDTAAGAADRRRCFGVGAVERPPARCRIEATGVQCDGELAAGRTLPALRDVLRVVNGFRHACALLRGGTVVCWGDNAFHQLAQPSSSASPEPQAVQGIFGATSLVAAGNGTCAIVADHAVRCWGDNRERQLSSKHGDELSVPTPIHF